QTFRLFHQTDESSHRYIFILSRYRSFSHHMNELFFALNGSLQRSAIDGDFGKQSNRNELTDNRLTMHRVDDWSVRYIHLLCFEWQLPSVLPLDQSLTKYQRLDNSLIRD